MIAIVVMLGFLFSTKSSVVENITTGFLLALGVSQVVYMGPAIYVAYRRGRPNIGKGLLIGAAITLRSRPPAGRSSTRSTQAPCSDSRAHEPAAVVGCKTLTCHPDLA